MLDQITQVAPWPVIVIFALFLAAGAYVVIRHRRANRPRYQKKP